jgi:hypothetical protein
VMTTFNFSESTSSYLQSGRNAPISVVRTL